MLIPSLESGGVLISRAVASQVPSALRGLTSVFGMGTGGSLLLSSPELWGGCRWGLRCACPDIWPAWLLSSPFWATSLARITYLVCLACLAYLSVCLACCLPCVLLCLPRFLGSRFRLAPSKPHSEKLTSNTLS